MCIEVVPMTHQRLGVNVVRDILAALPLVKPKRVWGFLDYIGQGLYGHRHRSVVYMYMSVCQFGHTPLLYHVLYATFFIVNLGA